MSQERSGRVMLVEDDERLSAAVARNLETSGFSVTTVGTGADALHRLAQDQVDVVVLDVGLPDTDGFHLCRDIRARVGEVPVLMLTARGEVASRVHGLESGADDYMVKPFAIRELAARLHALMRRARVGAPEELVVGELRLRPAEHAVWHGTQELELTPREFELLEVFMSSPGIAMSRATLADRAWNADGEAQSNVVDQYVRRLRDKVDRPFAARRIETVRGIGYRLKRSVSTG